jgi:hypothetical protein
MKNTTGSTTPSTHKSWEAPQLETYGSIETLTSGPSSGSLDLLIGSDGGFQSGGSIS